MILNLKCSECEQSYDLEVDSQDYGNWKFGGIYVQEAFPYLSADERELILSGICGGCFDKLCSAMGCDMDEDEEFGEGIWD